MKPHVRATVAAIALSHFNKGKVSSVYSYSESAYLNIDANVAGNRVDCYDYRNGCHCDGSIPSLYHYGESGHLDFNVKGSGNYSGYDYSTGSHFDIVVRGRSAEVYDYGTSSYFSYSL